LSANRLFYISCWVNNVQRGQGVISPSEL